MTYYIKEAFSSESRTIENIINTEVKNGAKLVQVWTQIGLVQMLFMKKDK